MRFRVNKTGFSIQWFPCGHFKVVLLLQFFFVSASVVSHLVFVFPYLFLTSPSFGASGGLGFVTVSFSGYPLFISSWLSLF